MRACAFAFCGFDYAWVDCFSFFMLLDPILFYHLFLVITVLRHLFGKLDVVAKCRRKSADGNSLSFDCTAVACCTEGVNDLQDAVHELTIYRMEAPDSEMTKL